MRDWKLVAKGKMRDRTEPVKWELYNIANDRSEQNNLASTYPDRVRKNVNHVAKLRRTRIRISQSKTKAKEQGEKIATWPCRSRF